MSHCSPDIERTSTSSQTPATTPSDDPKASMVAETQVSIATADETNAPSTQATPHKSARVPLDHRSRRPHLIPHKHKWAPTHTQSWEVGPQHGVHVHNAVPFLLCVPGGPKWDTLLESFVTFEGLSSSLPVSTPCQLAHLLG